LSITDRAEKLLESAQNGGPEVIDDILEAHGDCCSEDSTMCELCEVIEDELGDLVSALAKNVHATDSQQEKIWDLAWSWQGREIGVLLSFSQNPSISKSTKETLMDVSLLVSWDDAEDWFPGLFDGLRSNPSVSPAELAKFYEECDKYPAVKASLG
jgi:hypothetical protein